MLDFRVILIEACQTCQDGYIEHPWWVEYRRINPKPGAFPDSTTFPPKKITCSNCQGTSKLRTEVPLLEALRQLNIQPQPNVRGPFIQRVPA